MYAYEVSGTSFSAPFAPEVKTRSFSSPSPYGPLSPWQAWPKDSLLFSPLLTECGGIPTEFGHVCFVWFWLHVQVPPLWPDSSNLESGRRPCRPRPNLKPSSPFNASTGIISLNSPKTSQSALMPESRMRILIAILTKSWREVNVPLGMVDTDMMLPPSWSMPFQHQQQKWSSLESKGSHHARKVQFF